MAAYPYLVQTALNVTETVMRQWQTQPYRWLKERDLQAEIGGRLSQIFALQGKGELSGSYKWAAEGLDSDQTWSRVSFEPYVGYVLEDKRHWCYPDIVIWKDFAGGKSQPDSDTTTGRPILWACELKYGSKNSGAWDVDKLDHLISQERIDYGCAIRVHYETGTRDVGIEWTKHEKHGKRLWVGDVRLPKKRSGA